MIPTRMMTLFVLISLAGHMTVLSAAGLVGLYSGPSGEEIFQVELTVPAPEDSQNRKALPRDVRKTSGSSGLERYRGEDTVDLGSQSRKYTHYLSRLRKQIEGQWEYPPEAYAKKKTGTAVLQFSIAGDGSLLNACILASSGFEDLDSGALAVVRAAAPYDPLPEQFNLSRLNIVARFQYDIF
jgi:periplasmic protein TonB